VGFGSAVGILTAAALLWHEKVLRPAVATTVSELRHGPLEAVRPGDAVMVVDVDPPHAGRAAYLDLLRGELALIGATTIELSPGASGPGAIAIQGTRPGGASLEALLRLQQLGRAAAFAAGVYRDGFEILRTIVKAAEGMG
jgi:fructoselysine-6-P-deglycase FrlB-like protein